MLRRSSILILLVASVLLGGCGQPVAISEEMTIPAEPSFVEGSLYQNTRFGYEFTVPDGVSVYALNFEDQTAYLAGPEDEIVFVAGEGTNVLSIRGVQSEESAHTWLTSHVGFFYPNGEAAQQIDGRGGQQTLSLYGDGTSDSPARLMVIENKSQLLVITFEQEDAIFDTILSSFSLTL